MFFILIGVFAEFVAPYEPTKAGFDRELSEWSAADPKILG